MPSKDPIGKRQGRAEAGAEVAEVAEDDGAGVFEKPKPKSAKKSKSQKNRDAGADVTSGEAPNPASAAKARGDKLKAEEAERARQVLAERVQVALEKKKDLESNKR